MEREKVVGTVVVVAAIGGVAALIFLWMWGMPKYRIYKQDLRGQAELREAEWTKRVQVEQARAENDSANLKAEARIKQSKAEAEAEVERAKGVAAANEIIADSLKGNESYLRYLWIDKLGDNGNVIYVPTEAGLPILEANRLPND